MPMFPYVGSSLLYATKVSRAGNVSPNNAATLDAAIANYSFTISIVAAINAITTGAVNGDPLLTSAYNLPLLRLGQMIAKRVRKGNSNVQDLVDQADTNGIPHSLSVAVALAHNAIAV